jgi:hypothetical protein
VSLFLIPVLVFGWVFGFNILDILRTIFPVTQDVLIASGILFISHGFSFVVNVLMKKPERKIEKEAKGSLKEMMRIQSEFMSAFNGFLSRMPPLAFTIVLLIIATVISGLTEIGYKILIIILFMVIKTGWDLRVHQEKHNMIKEWFLIERKG